MRQFIEQLKNSQPEIAVIFRVETHRFDQSDSIAIQWTDFAVVRHLNACAVADLAEVRN